MRRMRERGREDVKKRFSPQSSQRAQRGIEMR